MAIEFNEKKIREKLIVLYKKFIQQPESEEVKSNLIKFDRDFGGASTYNDILKSQPISKDIEKALGGLIDIALYGKGFRSKEECLSFAKEVLEDLEKSKGSS